MGDSMGGEDVDGDYSMGGRMLNDGTRIPADPITNPKHFLYSIPSKPPSFFQSAGPKSKILNLRKHLR